METSKDRLSRLLEALSGAIPGPRGLEAQGARSDALQAAALSYQEVVRLPIGFSWPLESEGRFPPLANSAIYADPAAMLYNELAAAWNGLSISERCLGEGFRDDLPLSIRPNWGTVLVASLLGGEAEQTGESTPWIRRREDRPLSLEAIAEAEPELRTAGWLPRVLETYGAYQDLLEPWPELAAAIHLTLPDLQGPLDSVEQLAGEDLLVDMLDRPDLAARAFLRAAEIQVACARLLEPLTRDGPEGFSHQHGFLLKGRILIRCDSAVMISPELYRDLVAPADEFVLSSLGGGGIHSCGKIDHVAPQILGLASVTSFDFGQSFLNDVDALYAQARARLIPLLRVQPRPEELRDASVLRRFPTGVSLYYPAASEAEARDLLGAYIAAAARLQNGGQP